MQTENKNIIFSKEGQVGIIILNRPEKLNALNIQLMIELQECIANISEDIDIKVVLITGAGRAFSSGADYDFLADLGEPQSFRKTTKKYWHNIFECIIDMEKLFIAAINGLALGGALEMALACDLRVASENALLGLPQINFGLLPDAGGISILTRIVGQGVAKELILSGESITAEEARRLGLVNKVFPASNFFEEAKNYATGFAGKSLQALGLGKLLVNRSVNQDIKSGLNDVLAVQSLLLETKEYLEAIGSIKT